MKVIVEDMTPRPISEARDPDLRNSLPALERAARRARALAARGETPADSLSNSQAGHSPQTLDELDYAAEKGAALGL